MKITSELKAEIMAMVEGLDDNCELDAWYGVRVQDVPFELGKIDHCSKVWIDGDETEEELDGICACIVKDITCNEYYGDYIAIVTGDRADMGEDIGEIIIKDARVVAIIR